MEVLIFLKALILGMVEGLTEFAPVRPRVIWLLWMIYG